jgi:hypothetical protein
MSLRGRRAKRITRDASERRSPAEGLSGPRSQPNGALQRALLPLERRRGDPEALMSEMNQPVDETGATARLERGGRLGWLDLDGSGSREPVKERPRLGLRHGVVMLKGVVGLGEHHVGHDDAFAALDRSFDPPSRRPGQCLRKPDEEPHDHRGIKADRDRSTLDRCSGERPSSGGTFPWRTFGRHRTTTSPASTP